MKKSQKIFIIANEIGLKNSSHLEHVHMPVRKSRARRLSKYTFGGRIGEVPSSIVLFQSSKYSQISLIRIRVNRTFANSNKIFQSLEDLLTKNVIIRISVSGTFLNWNIFTIPQRVRTGQS